MISTIEEAIVGNQESGVRNKDLYDFDYGRGVRNQESGIRTYMISTVEEAGVRSKDLYEFELG